MTRRDDDQASECVSPPERPLGLAAGPISLLYENGYVRSIRLGGVEIVRRIYVALRDEYWNTIPGDLSNFSCETGVASFSLSFDSRHRRNDVDFLWHAQIEGRSSGELSFSMSGIALSAFKRNRIGLCVLHPLDTCKGKRCRIETIGGVTEETRFPDGIEPQLPFRNLRAISYAVAAGLDAVLRFDGDTFETEDQRNWTDASYKTYAPPFVHPIPIEMEKGSMVRQRVTIGFDKPSAPLAYIPREPRLTFGAASPSRPLPDIGVMDAGGTVAPMAAALLQTLGLSHLRVDVRFAADDVEARLARAREAGHAFGAPIELALHFTGGEASELVSLEKLFADGPFPVSRFLIFKDGEATTTPALIAEAGPRLRRLFPAANIGGGTNGHFLFINRRRPPAGLLDCICYAATPQVHAFDDTAIMENLPGLYETLRTAGEFSEGKQIAVSPLTLRPRKNPLVPRKDGGYDARQELSFTAAWTLGCIAYCVQGGASSLTMFETTGPGGLLAPGGERVYPVYTLFSRLAPLRKPRAQCRVSTDASGIVGLDIAEENGFYGIAANMTNEPRRVRFGGLPASCRYSILEDPSTPAADPPPCDMTPRDGEALLDLPPYALVCFVRGLS